MSTIKTLSLILISILLLVSLGIFGISFLLNSTVFNPDFLVHELDKLDLSVVVSEALRESPRDGDLNELDEYLITTVAVLEPGIKGQVGTVIHSVHDYVTKKKPEPELALTLRGTFFNTTFIDSVLSKLALTDLIEIVINESVPADKFSEQLLNGLVVSMAKHERSIEEQLVRSADPILEYLLGLRSDVDLIPVLRDILLEDEFVVTFIQEMDVNQLVRELITEQFIMYDYIEDSYFQDYLQASLDDIIVKIEPLVIEDVANAAPQIVDYILGESQDLIVAISVDPMLATIENDLREVFLDSPPTELVGLSQIELEQQFDESLAAFSVGLPRSITMSESLLDNELSDFGSISHEIEVMLLEMRDGITNSISGAEATLVTVRDSLSVFRNLYGLLIGIIIVLIVGIILISRRLKEIARTIGIVFAIYGGLTLVAVILIRVFIPRLISNALEGRILWMEFQPTNVITIPTELYNWQVQLLRDLISPLQWLSLGLFIAGVGLLVFSILYNRTQE